MKAVKIISVCLMLFALFGLSASALTQSEGFSSFVESSGADELYDGLDEETKKHLSELGINRVDFSSLFDISLSKAFNVIRKASAGSFEAPAKSLIKMLGITILVSVGESFIPEDEKFKPVISILSVVFIISSLISPLWQAMEAAVSSVGICGGFMKALIPVLTGVISASGNPALALSFQSVAFSMAQAISLVSEKYIVPLVGGVIALDITGALMPTFRLNGITDLIKKTVISVMSFTASLYVSFLGIKGTLANASDTVAHKGLKLIVSSAVPVVGGAVSEALTGIMGSIVLVKSTVGIFCIIVISVIITPAMIQLLFWIFAFKIGSATGEVLMQDGVSKLLKALSSAVTLLNVVLLLNGVLFIISIALILAIRH